MDNLIKLAKERWYDLFFYGALFIVLLIMFAIEGKVDEKTIIIMVMISFNIINLIWIYLRTKYQSVVLLWAKRHEWVNFLFIPIITLVMCISFFIVKQNIYTIIFLVVFIVYTFIRSYIRQKMMTERLNYEEKLQAKTHYKANYKKRRKK